MKLKLDENLGARQAQRFREAGHDVSTVAIQGLSGAEDQGVIEACRTEGRCLVTLDLDFSNPLIFKPAQYAGIAVLRLPSRPTPQDLSDAIETLIAALVARRIEGKLWSVQRGRIREYQPEEEDADS